MGGDGGVREGSHQEGGKTFGGDGFIDRTFRGLGFQLRAVDFISILSQDSCFFFFFKIQCDSFKQHIVGFFPI